MPQFLDLPRELRDMIYLSYLTSSLPSPTLSDTESTPYWNRPWEPKSGLGDHGCAFSSRRAPNTCANFLACNRQVNAEMLQTIERARRKGMLAARMDCMVKGEEYFFTWLSIPLVKTGKCDHEAKQPGIVPSWAARYLSTPRALGITGCGKFETRIEQLWIDIRLLTGKGAEGKEDKTAWAICAALKHVFEHDPDIIPTRDCRNDVSIDEVVLNVVSPPPPAKPPTTTTTTSITTTTTLPEVAQPPHAELVAKELVDVWNKLWSGDEFKARYYRNLLEKIQRVRVCVDGEMRRVRELRGELERGQKERRRIEMRMR